MCVVLRAAAAAALVMVSCARASAQIYESIGTRAQGMAGAFVAVADDATASWWNPAGLAGGAYLNAVFERGEVTTRDVAQTRSRGFAVAFPALGLSYYRLRVSEIQPLSPTGAGSGGRQDGGATPASVRSLAVTQFGATVGQSLGPHVVFGSTVKLVRAGVVTGAAAADSPLDAAADLPVSVDTHADLDIGVMVSSKYVRLGASVRNMSQPDFGSGDAAITLKRKARAGIALVGGRFWFFDALTAAGDADLTKTSTLAGEVRHVAGGGEVTLLGRHLSVRGGVMANTIGERRPATSFGVSVAAVRGIYIDAARIRGRDESVRGWSASLRLTF